MDERRRIYVVALMVVVCATSVRTLKFSIDTTWNGGDLDHTPVKVFLSASQDKEYLFFNVSAPFFNDPPSPPGPPGRPFYGLWEYEVVEAFFLNDANQYLEVEICPWGQHIVLLLSGRRVTVRHSLQMEVTTQRDGAVWRGSAAIPVSYLPEKVTKFNAYAIHGSDAARVYESLYPAPSTAVNPDFHALEYFKPIDLSSLLPSQATDPMSQLWSDALHGLFRYDIATTWDARPLSSPPVQITLQGFEAGVELNVTAPFYNDPAPAGTPGEPFYGLWDYEVVEMFFLNKNDEYLEVELGPWGQHLLLLLKGERNAIKHSLPLDYIITDKTDPVGDAPGQWRGSAMIPPGYFPPNVTLMNAYAIHGVDEARQYQALYPAPTGDPNYPQPDFHRLDLFRAMDFEFQVRDNENYSQVWQDAMGSSASTPTTPMNEDVMTTSLGPLRSIQTIHPEPANTMAPEPADPSTSEPMDPITQEPTALDTTQAVDPAITEPTDPYIPELKSNVLEATNLPEATNTESTEPTNTLIPKPINTVTPEPTETLPADSTDTVGTEATEAAPQDPTTLPPTTPTPTTLPEPLEASTPTLSPGNIRTAVRRRPQPQKVDTSQLSVNLASQKLPARPRRRPVPTPLRVRPNRRVANRKPPPQQGFPFHINLSPEDPFVQHVLSQQGLGFQALQGQVPLSEQNQNQQFSPRLQEFRVPVGQQFQPPRDQQFQIPVDQQSQSPRDQQSQSPRDQQSQSPRDQQSQSPRDQQSQAPRDQQSQPPRDQQFQPPRDQQSQAPRDQQSQAPRDQQSQPPRDQQFQPPRDQQSQPPRHQQFQPPRDQQSQPPRDQQFQPPRDQQFQPPRDQQFQPPRDQQFQPPRDQQSQPPRDQQSQPPRDQQFQPPRDQQFQPPRDQQSQPPRDQQFQPPRDQQSQPPRDQQSQPPRDQQFQPPRDQQSQPPRDQQSQPPRDQQFQPPRDQQSQPPRDQQFQPPRDQQSQPPRDQQFQPPRDQQFQPPRDQQFQPPRDQQFQPPRDQQSQPPRDQQFQPSGGQQFLAPQQEQPQRRPSSASEQQFPPSREGGAPLGVGEEEIGLQEVEEVLASLTEGSPALPPPHPICFSPGLVPDEHRCWVFHECELENGQWQVYSWKCIRGHVYDPFNVACVPGRCRRRG